MNEEIFKHVALLAPLNLDVTAGVQILQKFCTGKKVKVIMENNIMENTEGIQNSRGILRNLYGHLSYVTITQITTMIILDDTIF